MTSFFNPRIKMRHLLCLLEIVRQGSVAKAGSELGMTQPAVSKAIGELEAILGVELFDRSRRSLSLTAFGEMFVRYATPGLATLRQGIDAVEAARAGTNSLAFGALPTVAAGVVPSALLRFSQSSLACRTVVQSGPSPFLFDLLRTAAIEFVVGRMGNTTAMDGFSFEHLYSEELAFVVRPSHPLAGKDRPTLDQIVQFQLLMPPVGAIIRPAVDALLISGGVSRLHAEIETVSNSLGRSYTLATDAVWIISSSVVGLDLHIGQLVKLAVDVRSTLGPIGITTRTEGTLSETARSFIGIIREIVKETRWTK